MKKKEFMLPYKNSNIEDAEMMYIEGGKYDSGYKLDYCTDMKTTSGATMRSRLIRASWSWTKISEADLAAEIWTHAYAYYALEKFINVCEAAGYAGIINNGFIGSLTNGIDVKNGLDEQQVLGVERYKIYRAAFATAVKAGV